jgi:glutamyl-tRNA(Gln) amidotransferase subunit D
MFGPTSDEYCLLHRGTRVRKMHSSYRSTFRTIGDVPLAMISPTETRYLREDFTRRDPQRQIRIDTAFEEKVTILYYYPNMRPDVVDAMVEKGYRGIVIAGTGLGHVNKPLYPALERAAAAGVHIYMTVQTLWGYVQMYVYETGREIMGLGVVPAANMLPEVAYMKLCWALGQTDDREEVRRIMLTPVNDETTDREPYNGYLVYQGAIPEVQEFLRKIKR